MENDIKLVTIVERFSHLYDSKDKLYKDKLATDTAWQLISDDLSIPVDDCKQRWTSIRNRYSKERRKLEASVSKNEEEAGWYLMKYLSFLNSVVKKRKRFGIPEFRTDIETVIDTMDDDSYDELECECTINAAGEEVVEAKPVSPSKRRKINPKYETVDQDQTPKELVRASQTVGQKSTCSNMEDPIRNFCLSLCDDLKKVPRSKLVACKIAILEIVERYTTVI